MSFTPDFLSKFKSAVQKVWLHFSAGFVWLGVGPIMIFPGIYLRTYSSFPKPLLRILYLGIGGGLLSASPHYFANIAQELCNKVAEAKIS